MKRISTIVLTIILALLTACLMPAQVFADSLPDYVSEVKIYTGDYKAAEKEGYTILNGDNGKPVDLNQGAGGGWGSKGEKAVYLGYKTTKDVKDAITDLALMNMRGGYDVAEYEALMEAQLNSQIIPLVETFQAAIDEYRVNYNSDNEENQKRAQYVHDMLNKLTDDDCDNAPLGDLLLNETKFEMGDEAYNALSESEKKKHADIVTIIAQANGHATLLIENLITRAADTSDNTWLDRFCETTYDDLIEQTEMAPTDARRQVAKLYDDDAQILADLISKFRDDMEDIDDEITLVEETDPEELAESYKKFSEIKDNATVDELEAATEEFVDVQNKWIDYNNALQTVAIYGYLQDIEYEDGTLLDFFMRSDDELYDEIELLYPLAASLSAGQRAGLEFISLREFMVIAATDSDSYGRFGLEDMEEGSIYEDVDREIYQKGGVALTSDALRADALSKVMEEKQKSLSSLTVTLIVFSSIAAGAFIISAGVAAKMLKTASYWRGQAAMVSDPAFFAEGVTYGNHRLATFFNDRNLGVLLEKGDATWWTSRAQCITASRARISMGVSAGIGVAMVALAALTTYLAWKDMQAYYKVDFTPIPHYMVDEKDLIGYNKKGEKIVLKNQSAYYKAVECNRTQSDEFYKTLGTCADMNGDVGKQWLALYSVKNELMDPILASSLKAVVGSAEIPAGYTTGIHMFGSESAFNLNSNLYDWNNSAKSVFVYFKTDEGAKTSTSGSNFSGGTVVLTGGAGIAIGALATALGMTATGKKKREEA